MGLALCSAHVLVKDRGQAGRPGSAPGQCTRQMVSLYPSGTVGKKRENNTGFRELNVYERTMYFLYY